MDNSSGNVVHGSPSKPSLLVMVQAAQDIIDCAQKVQQRTTGTGSRLGLRVAVASELSRKSIELAAVLQSAHNYSVDYITAQVLSLKSRDPSMQPFLNHFEDKFKSIVQNVLKNATGDRSVLRRTLEECYNASIDDSGALHLDSYFNAMDETLTQSSFDPDLESEQYYDHENRLEVDDAYARIHLYKRMLKQPALRAYRKNKNSGWVQFWARALNDCTGGPTLFWPFANGRVKDYPRPPRYLFRTFDTSSSGKSDGMVVASVASILKNLSISKKDLLSLDQAEAAEMLSAHLLNYENRNGSSHDNLMSWSSSLLFVLQYAIWKSTVRQAATSDIKIIVVDTTKFPLGQFARDIWLLQNYHNAADKHPDIQNLLDLRTRNTGYDNGEYLSQGTLNHKGRSCTLTLEQLEQAGLYGLYPELNDPNGKKLWTRRVGELRFMWSRSPRTSPQEEIQHALRIATVCARDIITPVEFAILLLSFRSRELQDEVEKSRQTYTKENIMDDPEDVQRYLSVMQGLRRQDRQDEKDMAADVPLSRLEELFICEPGDDE